MGWQGPQASRPGGLLCPQERPLLQSQAPPIGPPSSANTRLVVSPSGSLSGQLKSSLLYYDQLPLGPRNQSVPETAGRRMPAPSVWGTVPGAVGLLDGMGQRPSLEGPENSL